MNAPELIKEVAKEPTLDVYLDRDPRGLSDAELTDLIEALRADRALFLVNEDRKKAKKEGVLLDDDAEWPEAA